MIKSFADKYTKALFDNKSVPKWKNIEKVAKRKLDQLNKVKSLLELTNPPRNRLEALRAIEKAIIAFGSTSNIAFALFEKKGNAYEVEINKHYD